MRAAVTLLLLMAAQPLAAQKSPESCLSPAGNAKATAVHGGRTYYFSDPACRDEFLSDPERFSQLYDALLELETAGKKIEPPIPSLVPS
jgi:YHS domain-containing protein